MLAKPSKSPVSNEAAMAALADLFAEKATPKGKASSPAKKKAPIPMDERPLAVQYAARKTGSISWRAIARVVIIQRQECKCCGNETKAVQDEFFLLENGVTRARWLRHEAYGIIDPEALPIEVQVADDVRRVSACASCSDFDIEFAILSRKQMELPL